MDDRAAPRVVAPMVVRYRLLAADEATDRWLAGDRDPRPFREFVGRTEISVSGMLLPCPPGAFTLDARILVEITSAEAHPIRLVGRVRRLHPLIGPTAAGVEFVEIGDEDADELAAFTLVHLQEGGAA